MVDVIVSDAAQKQYSHLPRVVKAGVQRVFAELHHWPNVSGAKPLRGGMKGMFRKRTGDYRIVFRVVGQAVVIVKIGHRKDVYE